MWARVVEIMLGCWLVISPFIFRHPADQNALWTNDLASGFAIIVIAFISFWNPLRHAHWLIAGFAIWLIGFGRFAGGDPNLPALQNDMVVGILLLMFAIIPNETNRPPQAWRDYYSRK